MEEAFYKGRLADRYELEVLIPQRADRQIIHRVIYDCFWKNPATF